MMTNLANLFSTRVVTWFNPNLVLMGLVVFFYSFCSTLSLAACKSLAFFSCLVSGLYLRNNWNKALVWFLSRVLVNWLTAGGTLSLFNRILFCLYKRMYFGHLTHLVTSLLGLTSPPIRMFLGLDSKSGFFWTWAAFLPLPAFFLLPPFTWLS